MLSYQEACSIIIRAADVFTRALVDEFREMQCEQVKPLVEARWVRSRQAPDYMYCSSCFRGYDTFEPSDRVMMPVICFKCFLYCPICGADTTLDDEVCSDTPRFEDEMSDEERVAGNRRDDTPAGPSYDDFRKALRNLEVYIPHGNAVYRQDAESSNGDEATKTEK